MQGLAPEMVQALALPLPNLCAQGDARASFPPDLGQGVNSALEDCDELAQVGWSAHTHVYLLRC